MKRYLRISTLLISLLLICGLSGCSNGGGGGDLPPLPIARYSYTGTSSSDSTKQYTNILYFKTQEVYTLCQTWGDQDEIELENGTFTGDPTVDGSVTITKKEGYDSTGSWVELLEPTGEKITISGQEFNLRGKTYKRVVF